mmetsp:Transcript_20977/g.39274  ORF Transcript_20977/g.39274 Transcript_20977/m.39274 type:complete len:308 (+) Transcript_20977:708-1631(+)
MAELAQRVKNVGVASVEEVEASDGVNLAVGPAGGQERLQQERLVDEHLDLGKERAQGAASLKEGNGDLHHGRHLGRPGFGAGDLVELLENLAEASLVQTQELEEEGKLPLEGAEALDGVDVVLEVLVVGGLPAHVLETAGGGELTGLAQIGGRAGVQVQAANRPRHGLSGAEGAASDGGAHVLGAEDLSGTHHEVVLLRIGVGVGGRSTSIGGHGDHVRRRRLHVFGDERVSSAQHAGLLALLKLRNPVLESRNILGGPLLLALEELFQVFSTLSNDFVEHLNVNLGRGRGRSIGSLLAVTVGLVGV